MSRLGNGIKIGLTIMGTTIGAGFASGREIWEFFTSYGYQSSFGLIITMLLFVFSSMIILWMSWRNQSNNYYDILELLMGKRIARVFDGFIFLYLFSGSVVMFAGSGAIFDQWGFPILFGVIVLGIALWLILMNGVSGLVQLNSVLMPIKMIVMIYIGFIFIRTHPQIEMPFIRQHLQVWPSAITYVAFNVISLLGVLSTLGKSIHSKSEIVIGGIIGGIGLGSIAMILNLSLLRVENAEAFEIPLFSLIEQNQPILLALVSIILWFAIYTTALSNLHGLIYRIKKKVSYSTGMTSLLFILVIIPLSFIGFSNLIKILYPLYGVVNLYVLALLILYPFQRL